MTERDDSLPIACSLAAPEAAQRERQWRQLLDQALVSREAVHDGWRVELHALPGMSAELDRLVAAEHVCCPFLTLRVERNEAGLVLTATAAAPAASIIEQLLGGGRG